jgi:hypothetical protein
MATQNVMNRLRSQAGILESLPTSFDSVPPGLQHHPSSMLLGLPCARCKAYFAADLGVCPICGCKERVALGKRATSLGVM